MSLRNTSFHSLADMDSDEKILLTERKRIDRKIQSSGEDTNVEAETIKDSDLFLDNQMMMIW